MTPRIAALAIFAVASPIAAQLRLGGEFQVNTYTTGPQASAAVAMDEGGAFIIVWESRQLAGSDDDLIAQLYSADGTRLGAEFLVNAYTTSSQFLPSVAFGVNGEFVVVWTSRYQAGNLMSVFGRRFDSTGNPLGSEFQVNSYTTSIQLYPSVAADSDGKFLVVWEQALRNGAILGKRFDDGFCPGTVMITLAQAPPDSEVAVIAAANENGSMKGGTICSGTTLEIGEPFTLPPSFVIVDSEGNGSIELELPDGRCFLEALALADCSTSGAVQVSPAD